jgi:tRNA 2-thiocytidine biosynthesis protein TtcA
MKRFPIIPCDLCGSQDNLQRRQVKAMLREWEQKYPGRIETMFGSLTHVQSSHLLDRSLFDFARLRAEDSRLAEDDIFGEVPIADAVIPLHRVDAA